MARDPFHQDELYGLEGRPLGAAAPQAAGSSGQEGTSGAEGAAAVEEDEEAADCHFGPQWVLLKFDQPVTAPRDALVIGAKFDADIHGEACRLAFYGRLVQLLDPAKPQDMAQLKVFKLKVKQGVIERLQPDGTTAICKNLFKKETDISAFANLKVTTGRGEVGVIESSFGKSGKFKVTFPPGVLAQEGRTQQDNVITLRCKRYAYDPNGKKVLRQ